MTNSSDDNSIARLLAGLPPKTLADLLTERQALPTTNNAPGIFGDLAPRPSAASNPFAAPGLFGSPPLAALPVAPQPTGLAGALWPYMAPLGLGNAAPPVKRALPVAPAVTKRKGFFSFHYDDIMRVNNVRNAWKLAHPDREMKRNFYDRSLWETTKRTNPDGLKNLIRRGMEHSSAVCVMVGSGTYLRPWVRYEIARAVVDNRGLLAVHINNLTHVQRRTVDALGPNPLDFMGVYQTEGGVFRLCEKNWVQDQWTGRYSWQWQTFGLHRGSVALPKYLAVPAINQAVALSSGTSSYDYVYDLGKDNLGHWIDAAARQVGR